MYGQSKKRALRLVSLGLVLCFTTSLWAPYVHAQQSTQVSSSGPASVQAMTESAKKGLSTLWGAWLKSGSTSNVKPTRAFAFDFFKSQGATESQATLLVNNAQSANQLNAAIPSSQSGFKQMLGKWFGLGGTAASPAATTVKTQPAAAGSTAAASTTGGGGVLGNVLRNVKDTVNQATQKVALVGKRGVNDVQTGVTTAFLTVKDSFNIGQFYNIPVNQNSSIHVTGGSNYTTKFVNKGPMGIPIVNEQISSKINLVDAIKQNETVLKLDQLQTQYGPATVERGPLGSMISKFTDTVSNLKNKLIGGKAPAQPELSKIDVQANLLENAQGLTQVEKSITTRINELTKTAAKLQRPVPEQEILDLKKAYADVQSQKKVVLDQLEGVQGGKFGKFVKSGLEWAAWSVGVTASINILKQVVGGEKIDFKKAFSFVGDPSFLAGTAGGFLGSMVLTKLAGSLIPGGGLFMSVLPGFLGASLGFEAGSSLFGGGSGDWLGVIGQTIASAGGYALTAALIGGTGIPAVLGAIGAGTLFNFIYSKLMNTGSADQPDLPPPALDPNLNAELTKIQGNANGGVPTGAQPANPGEAVSTIKHEMDAAYTAWMNYIKDGKVSDARQAYEKYSTLQKQLNAAESVAVNQN